LNKACVRAARRAISVIGGAKASAFANGLALGGGVSITRAMGSDVSKPLIAVAYGAKLANTGDVNGLVVLSCQ
jgi:hypothetical protein